MNDKNFDILENAVRALNQVPVPPGPSTDLIADTLDKIEQTQQTQNTNPLWERIRTMKPIGKLAAAAIILFAVSAVFLFNPLPSSVALADVYSRVQQARAFMYKMSATIIQMDPMPGQPAAQEVDASILISTEYGMRLDNKIQMPDTGQTMDQQMIFIPDEKVALMIIPDEKRYMRMEFTDDLMQRTQQQNNDPRQVIKQMLNTKYTDLGRSQIDGITVQGFETDDPAYFGGAFGQGGGKVTLWVNAETWMPVRLEMDVQMGDIMQMQATMHDFQWDVPVSPDEFRPDLSADYEEFMNMKMPEMDESSAIKGFARFLELAGEYPRSLDMMTIIQDTNKALMNSDAFREKIMKQKDEGNERAMVDLAVNEVLPVQGLAGFYMLLVQDKKDPLYHPDVAPGDADRILLRWKLEDGRYRAIFGDLSTGEMSYDNLIAIEPPAESAEQTAP